MGRSLPLNLKLKRYDIAPWSWDRLSPYGDALPTRARVFMQALSQKLAQKVYTDLVTRLPNEAGELKKAARVAEVKGEPFAFAVYLHSQRQTVLESDKDRVILSVAKKRGAFRVPETISILEDFSPWTLDTIPVSPDPRFATVTQRRVSARVVEQVRKDRKRDRKQWRPAFAAVVSAGKLAKREQIEAVSDLLLQSVLYEFGLGGKTHPHWRPAILNNIRPEAVASLANNDQTLRKVLSDPGYEGYKAWPRLPNQIAPNVVDTFHQFQKKLGILT